MNPKDLDEAAKAVRHAVENAARQALVPFQVKSVVFLSTKNVVEGIGEYAETCIRTLPQQLQIHKPEHK